VDDERIMKKAFLTIVAFATSLLVAAQHKIKFSYDAAGNRVAREAVIPKLKVAQAKPSGNIPLNDLIIRKRTLLYQPKGL